MSSTKIQDAIQAVEKSFGPRSILAMDAAPSGAAVLPTGIAALDGALGGGVPRGRISELAGARGTEKAALVYQLIATTQKAGGVCAMIDLEQSFDPERARRAGVDLEKLLISQPDCAEQALEITDTLARTGAIDLIVIDAVGSLVTKDEIAGESLADGEGYRARLMSQAIRKLTALLSRSAVAIVFVNHLERQGVYGSSAPGANALKFYSSLRVSLKKTATLIDDFSGKSTGALIEANVVKNKIVPPFKQARLLFQDGAVV